MRMLLATILATILPTIMPFAAFADEAGIRVDHVWARAAPAGHEGAVYLTITDGGAPDTLTGVTTPIAVEAAVHQSMDDHGVTKMRPIGPLSIPSGKPLMLAPRGYHIMLSGLKQSLKEGDSFPITLTFAKAGPVTATATVAEAGARMPRMDRGSMGGMGTTPTNGGEKHP
jgi:copper(I)-binding protein